MREEPVWYGATALYLTVIKSAGWDFKQEEGQTGKKDISGEANLD